MEIGYALVNQVELLTHVPNDRGDGGGSAGKQGHRHQDRGDIPGVYFGYCNGDYGDGLWCGVGEKMKNWHQLERN